eukprot:gene3735-6265_t
MSAESLLKTSRVEPMHKLVGASIWNVCSRLGQLHVCRCWFSSFPLPTSPLIIRGNPPYYWLLLHYSLKGDCSQTRASCVTYICPEGTPLRVLLEDTHTFRSGGHSATPERSVIVTLASALNKTRTYERKPDQTRTPRPFKLLMKLLMLLLVRIITQL